MNTSRLSCTNSRLSSIHRKVKTLLLMRPKAYCWKRYKDNEPCFDLCVRIQEYYKQHSRSTRVKVAGLLTMDQAIRLAGAQTMTIAPAVLRELSQSQDEEASLASKSLYRKQDDKPQKQDLASYTNDEVGWREAFMKSDHGKGAVKTKQVCKVKTSSAWRVADPVCRPSTYFPIIRCRQRS